MSIVTCHQAPVPFPEASLATSQIVRVKRDLGGSGVQRRRLRLRGLCARLLGFERGPRGARADNREHVCISPGLGFLLLWDNGAGAAPPSGGNIRKAPRGGAPGGSQRVKLEDAPGCKHRITRWSRMSQDAELNTLMVVKSLPAKAFL